MKKTYFIIYKIQLSILFKQKIRIGQWVNISSYKKYQLLYFLTNTFGEYTD